MSRFVVSRWKLPRAWQDTLVNGGSEKHPAIISYSVKNSFTVSAETSSIKVKQTTFILTCAAI